MADVVSAHIMKDDYVLVFDEAGNRIPSREGFVSKVDSEIQELLNEHRYTRSLSITIPESSSL